MIERIKELRRQASPLEPDAAWRSQMQNQVMGYADRFLADLPGMPAFFAQAPHDAPQSGFSIAEAATPLDQLLAWLAPNVDRQRLMLGHAGNLSFIPESGLHVAALADYLASISNKYAGVYFAAPGAIRVERSLLRWMAGLVGYPDGASGDLTSGGSIANLVGIVTARDAHRLKADQFAKTVVYLSAQTHHSAAKALRIAGLGEAVQRHVPLDEFHRMDVPSLMAAIEQDRAAGLNPWLIIATAGTTDTGAVDPLEQIAHVAKSNDLWLHVDGAYGAPFVLCPPGKQLMAGLERSDSLIMDPHKSLFMPLGLGAVLVRDVYKLRDAHYYDAGYLQDRDSLGDPAQISPADLSPELTRPFRGLRLWMSLKLLGVGPFRAALEEKMLLARYAHRRLSELDRFEVGVEPDLSIVTFRYIPERGDVEAFNRLLLKAIQDDGRIYISSTQIDGRFTLRLAILGFRTHLETVDLALSLLAEKARLVADTI